MCLAIPTQILSIDNAANTAVVAINDIKKEISISLLETAAVGDYVLVHFGYALEKLDPIEAERTLNVFAQLQAAED